MVDNVTLCESLCSVTITEPSTSLSCTFSNINDVSCLGGSDGSATVGAIGGSGNYNYTWSGGLGMGSSKTNLTAGTYEVTVVDNVTLCESICSLSIVEPVTSVTCEVIHIDHVSCLGGSNGAATVSANGGSGNYNYTWSDGLGVNSSISNLTAGEYIVTVSDENNCTNSCNVIISEPTQALSCSISLQQGISCYGERDGALNVIAVGGTGTYTYSLNGENFSDNHLFENLGPGLHEIEVKDQNNCISSCAISLNEPLALGFETDVIGSECEFNNSGVIQVINTVGGTTPYEYRINQNSWTSSNVFTDLSSGIYTIELKDANNCVLSKEVEVERINCIFDLALIKKLIPTSQEYFAGDTVEFLIEVFNQGNLDAFNVDVVDYYNPDELVLADANWIIESSGKASLISEIDLIEIGKSETVEISFVINPSFEANNLVNYAEIASAENELNPDSPDYLDVDSSPENNRNDDELDFDNKILDSDGMRQDDDIDSDDYDPASADVVQIFDLALKNELSSSYTGPIRYNDLLEFKITVCNQGTIGAKDVEIASYLPDGFSFSISDNPSWIIDPNSNIPMYVFPQIIEKNTCKEVEIYLNVEQTNGGEKDWIMYSEILKSFDRNGLNHVDQDSEEASNSIDENQIEPNEIGDNDIFSNGLNGNQDDHDPAGIELFDLALTKTSFSNFGPYRYGDHGQFTIQVYNQGSIRSNEIELTDYLPCGFEYLPSNSSNGWVYNSTNKTIKYNIGQALEPGEMRTVSVDVEIHPCAQNPKNAWTNNSEISAYKSLDPDYPNPLDVDSVADDDPGNDVGGVPNNQLFDNLLDGNIYNSAPGALLLDDEDDHDPEQLDVFDLAIRKTSSWMGIDSIGPFSEGEIVEFNIDVFNQGNVDAYEIELTDYLKSGFVFDSSLNPGWIQLPNGWLEFNFTGPLKEGDSIRLVLSLEIQALSNASLGDWYNEVEITNARDMNGVIRIDADSYADSNPDNDNDLLDGPDEDQVFNGDQFDNVIDELFEDPFLIGDFDEDDNDAAEVIVVGALCGYVWEDCNGDGIRNDGLGGLAEVEVEIYNAYNVYVESVVTNQNGFYILENMIPGNYFIKVLVPEELNVSDFRQGTILELDSDIDNSNGLHTSPLSLVKGGLCNPGNWDVGLYACIPIGGTVWFDSNENDLQDVSENGINGINVELYKYQNEEWELFQIEKTDHKPGTPSDDGYYKFCVAPGTYELKFDIPDFDWVPAVSNTGLNGNLDLTNENESIVDSDINYWGNTFPFTIDCSMADVCNIGAGFYPMAQIGNRVWLDANGDGVQDLDEIGLPGVLVEAFNSNDQMLRSSVTDLNGEYVIDHLGKDDYYFKFSPPGSYGATLANVGSDEQMDSDIDNSNGYMTTSLFSLNPGDDITTIDAGLTFGALPAEWLSFTVKHRGSHNQLNWSTATEVNTHYFEIEKAINNTSYFESIGKISAAGNVNSIQNYETPDYDIEVSGTYYYRLKLVDLDGKISFSDIVSVRIKNESQIVFELYPNPSSDVVNFDLDIKNREKVNVSIWDISGKLIDANAISKELETGTHTESFSVSRIPEGVYTLKINIGKQNYQKKLIIVRE